LDKKLVTAIQLDRPANTDESDTRRKGRRRAINDEWLQHSAEPVTWFSCNLLAEHWSASYR
jgi:hypothetical protein